jgi:putative inorganic carbon (hco3(-)) transporter
LEPTPHQRDTLAYYLVAAAAAASLASIAASQILLGAALVAIFITHRRLESPRLGVTILALFLWTLLSAALSADPAASLPQIKKFYVWLMFPAAYTVVRGFDQARRLYYACAAVGTASALYSLVQFARKFNEASALGRPFNEYYAADRITGFMSHWMTFGGGMLIVFCILGAAVLFDLKGRARLAALASTAIVATAIILGYTRSIWLASAVSGSLLVFCYRRWMAAVLPLALAAGALVAPEPVHGRIVSIWRPQQGDSNLHREALRATGWNMIAARPLFGFGPQQVERYVPAYMPPRYQPIPGHWWVGHLHNQLLHYAAERGLPAAAALAAFFLWSFWQLWHLDMNTLLNPAALATLAGILAGGLFEVNLGDSEVLALFLAIAGAALGAARLSPTPRDSESPVRQAPH